MAESRSIYDMIQDDIKRSSGGGFAGFFRLRPDSKVRIRFLKDFEEATAITFHTRWEDDQCMYDHPCFLHFEDKGDCPHCNDRKGRSQTLYHWPIYNYETKQVEVFGFKQAKTTPIQALAEVYKENNSITEFDIVINRTGGGFDTKYTTSVIASSVGPFKKAGVKPFSKKKILRMVSEAYTNYGDDVDDDADEIEDEDVEITPPKRKGRTIPKKPKIDDDPDDQDYDEDDDEEYEEEPPKRKPKPKAKKAKRKPEPEYDEDDDDDEAPFDYDDPEDAEYYDDDDDDEELPPPKPRKKGKARR